MDYFGLYWRLLKSSSKVDMSTSKPEQATGGDAKNDGQTTGTTTADTTTTNENGKDEKQGDEAKEDEAKGDEKDTSKASGRGGGFTTASIAAMIDKRVVARMQILTGKVVAGARSISANSVDMAKQAAFRIYQISGIMTGKCMLTSKEDAGNMRMPRDHKELLDELRRNKPDQYKLLLSIATRFSEANATQQLEMIQRDIPAALQAMQASP